jgi:hypothetical protein
MTAGLLSDSDALLQRSELANSANFGGQRLAGSRAGGLYPRIA